MDDTSGIKLRLSDDDRVLFVDADGLTEFRLKAYALDARDRHRAGEIEASQRALEAAQKAELERRWAKACQRILLEPFTIDRATGTIAFEHVDTDTQSDDNFNDSLPRERQKTKAPCNLPIPALTADERSTSALVREEIAGVKRIFWNRSRTYRRRQL